MVLAMIWVRKSHPFFYLEWQCQIKLQNLKNGSVSGRRTIIANTQSHHLHSQFADPDD